MKEQNTDQSFNKQLYQLGNRFNQNKYMEKKGSFVILRRMGAINLKPLILKVNIARSFLNS